MRLLSYAKKPQNSQHNRAQQALIYRRNSEFVMERIVLVGFCPMVMGTVVNCIRLGVGTLWWSIGMILMLAFVSICTRLCKMNSHATPSTMMDLMGVMFALQQGSMRRGDNYHHLDGTTVQITEVFTADLKNCTMRHLYHHNHGYAHAIILSYCSPIRMVVN
jgi:hypothetical protein